MATIAPYIPESITVHLGSPDSNAENVTVSFSDYVKNVLSSEVYPTWEPAALRANALAVISFALNRVYTEYYRSRGYPFDITSSTAIDQKFINGRNIYENISALVDELFTDYLRRQGYVEPLAAKFCNGVTTTCDGLSQWGSQELAQQGYNSVDILRHYYGDDIELVVNAPVSGVRASYPGFPLRRGMVGENVIRIQYMLNRISQDYPAIPKIPTPLNGQFDEATEQAVRRFQQIFSLTPDGVVRLAAQADGEALSRSIYDMAVLPEMPVITEENLISLTLTGAEGKQVTFSVDESGVREGLVLVNPMHITASVFINDNESGLHHDFEVWLEKLAPEKPYSQYRHNGYEDNADAHLKRTVMGRESVVAVTDGRLDFGTWEQIFYFEFDGLRDKRILIKVIGE